MDISPIVVAGAVGAVGAFVGAIIGALLSRRASKETDNWRRREESLRMLRWASDAAGAITAEPLHSALLCSMRSIRALTYSSKLIGRWLMRPCWPLSQKLCRIRSKPALSL